MVVSPRELSKDIIPDRAGFLPAAIRQRLDEGRRHLPAGRHEIDMLDHVNLSAAIARAGADRTAPIVTTIEGPAPWWPAEDYHQRYWQGEGQNNAYCMAVIPPKLAKLRKGFAGKMKG